MTAEPLGRCRPQVPAKGTASRYPRRCRFLAEAMEDRRRRQDVLVGESGQNKQLGIIRLWTIGIGFNPGID